MLLEFHKLPARTAELSVHGKDCGKAQRQNHSNDKNWSCVSSHSDENSTRLVLEHKVNTNPSRYTPSIVTDGAE